MISFYLIWCIGYFGMLFWLAQKWPKKPLRTDFSSLSSTVSLIIPFRNEMENAPRLLAQLQKICMPHLEVILIDDQSEDGSFEFFFQHRLDVPNLLLVKSPGIGKKAALAQGIHTASGEFIITSDADCRFPKFWVEQMIAPFSGPGVQLVAGPVISDTKEDGFFEKFQQLEWASILLVTQFFFSKNTPLMCSGANLAFRKSAFFEVGGYLGNEHLLSGDDEFLLKKIVLRYGPESCLYMPFSDHLVTTDSHSSLRAMLNQRIRWAGKWSVHRSFSHGFSAVFSFLAQLIWIGSFWFFSIPNIGELIFGLVWLAKTGAERVALGKVLKRMETTFSLRDLILTSLLHPIYVLGVGLGAIRGKFDWKGRSN
jgi:cellulose synthase/poly-beta-1,6-N-acetylglucosamine synthase-like glycosyltransferase